MILTFLVFFLSSTVCASEKESASALQQLKKDVRTFTLDNGLRVIFYKRGVAPVFSGVLSVRVGGVDEQVGDTGASHLLEHMAFKGTTELGTRDYEKEKVLLAEVNEILKGGLRTPLELSKQEQATLGTLYQQLEKLWVPDGFSRLYREKGATGLNATTAKEVTNYFVSLPSSAFEFWCWMESERLLYPVLRQYYKERDVVLEERRMRYEDDPGGKLYEQLLSVAYLQHPYRNPVIGYEKDLRKLSINTVADLLKTYYVPENMVLAIVGDIDPDDAIDDVKKYFGRMPLSEAPVAHPKTVEPEQDGERNLVVEHPSSPQLAIAYKKAQYPHPDDPALSVLFEILGGSRITPLYTELIEKRKVATHFSFFEAPGIAYPNMVVFYGQPRAPHTNKQLLRAFDDVLKKFIESDITEEQIAIARRQIAMSFLTGLSSNLSLARDMAEAEVVYGDWASSIDWYEKVVAVSRDDIKRVARTYLVPERRTVGRLETQKGGQS